MYDIYNHVHTGTKERDERPRKRGERERRTKGGAGGANQPPPERVTSRGHDVRAEVLSLRNSELTFLIEILSHNIHPLQFIRQRKRSRKRRERKS